MILANMCILQAQRIAPKIYFFGIPDTRNTRWFWKKIGYGSGTAKNYRVGSGIGYPSVTAKDAQPQLPLCHKPGWDGPRQTRAMVFYLKPQSRKTMLLPRFRQSDWLSPLWHSHASLLHQVVHSPISVPTLPCLLRYLDNGSIYYLEGDLDFWGYCQPGCGEQVVN